MRIRDTKGCYTEHLSPGDGTGFSNVPVQDAQTHQASCDDATDGEQSAINYRSRTRPVRS